MAIIAKVVRGGGAKGSLPAKGASGPKGVTKAAKVAKKVGRPRKLASGKPRKDFYSNYIYRVLKQVHPGSTISAMAMSTMNSMMKDVFEKLMVEVSRLIQIGNKKTLSVREMSTAVRLLFPGELCKHAVTEASKAIHKYKLSKAGN